MVFVDIPKIGDVVIRRGYGLDAKPLMALSSVPGPDQFGYATRGEANRMACAYAEHAGVDVWRAESPNEFTLLFSCRASTYARTASVSGLADRATTVPVPRWVQTARSRQSSGL